MGTQGRKGGIPQNHSVLVSINCLGLTSCERNGGNPQWIRDEDCKKTFPRIVLL